jgi:SulP family sulfate permease
MAEVTNIRFLSREFAGDEPGDAYASDPNAARRRDIPPGVVVYEIDGPFFFGAAEKFKDTLGQIGRNPRVLIIRMRDVPAIDSTGMHALGDIVRRSRKDGTMVLLSDVHAQPMVALGRSSLLAELGEEHVFGNLDDALNAARVHLGLPIVPRPVFAAPTVARETPASGVTAASPAEPGAPR